jgi:DNA repair protein RecO (recombination protein O)
LRGLLLAFQPLELGWAGKGEVQTLMKAEWQGGQPLLSGKALFCGYYLNELLMNLLPREDAHENLFAAYSETMQRFAKGLREADLRSFEHALLAELGYGLTLSHDVDGNPIEAAAFYAYQIERGAVRLSMPGSSSLSVCGKTLQDMASEDFSDPRSLLESKQLMRALMTHYLGGQPLETRKIFMELQEL